jgi:hypothetical protein
MIHPALIAIACLPVLLRLIPLVVPAQYLEPYAWWSSDVLNRKNGEVGSTWRNMGWWEVCRPDRSSIASVPFFGFTAQAGSERR